MHRTLRAAADLPTAALLPIVPRTVPRVAGRAFSVGIWIASASILAGLLPLQGRAQTNGDSPDAGQASRAVTAAPAAWPAKPIRLVVPLPAGGDADGLAAPLAAALSKQLGQPVVLDHRPGIGGNLGAEIVASSAADGYTFLLGSVDQAIAAASRARLAYDLQRDLAPVTLLAVAPGVVVVDATRTSFATIADLVRSRQAHPAAAGAAAAPMAPAASTTTSMVHAAGSGNPWQLAAERLRQLLGDRAAAHRLPRGAATLEDLRAGHADFMIAPMHLALPAIREGGLRALAVTTASRSFALPGVPTLAEAGVDGIRFETWYALWSPAGTPAPINQAMQRSVAAVLDRKEMVDIWNRLGAQRGGQPQSVLALMVHSEVLNWGQMIKALDTVPYRQESGRTAVSADAPRAER